MPKVDDGAIIKKEKIIRKEEKKEILNYEHVFWYL
jgi:hypothetical protein